MQMIQNQTRRRMRASGNDGFRKKGKMYGVVSMVMTILLQQDLLREKSQDYGVMMMVARCTVIANHPNEVAQEVDVRVTTCCDW